MAWPKSTPRGCLKIRFFSWPWSSFLRPRTPSIKNSGSRSSNYLPSSSSFSSSSSSSSSAAASSLATVSGDTEKWKHRENLILYQSRTDPDLCVLQIHFRLFAPWKNPVAWTDLRRAVRFGCVLVTVCVLVSVRVGVGACWCVCLCKATLFALADGWDFERTCRISAISF